MPTLFKMSDEKETAEGPTVVFAQATPAVPPRKTKKYVIIAVSAILSVAIILTAILVGMYMFTQAQKDILKYTLDLNANSKQQVTSDPNENIVQYHVSSPGQETWIVNDFNKDIQVVKIQTQGETTCFVNALNRTTAMDPSKIAKPETNDIKGASSVTYITSNTPIGDTSFLSKTAKDMCSGVSTYWVYPQCLNKQSTYANDTQMSPKSKRDVDGSPYYYTYTRSWSGYPNGLVCVEGCCKGVCACQINYYYQVTNGVLYCTWYTYDCNGNAAAPPYYYCNVGRPSGLSCPNKSPAAWPTC